MDQSSYKQTKTKRGFTYSYYHSAPASGKPVLFLSHGFPSPSFLWQKQVAFFQPLGYGLIVPDHLGYGGTDKPTDPKLYVGRGLAEDMVDILDAEAVAQVIAIGHDWGSYLVVRMLHYCPQRISAVALIAVGYIAADGVNMITMAENIKAMMGYDVGAYQRFFVQPDAAEVIEKNIDSFISMVYPETPDSWMKNMCVDGGARAWIEGNTIAPLPSYATPADMKELRTALLSGGLSAPLCWYKAQIEQANIEEDAKLPPAARDIAQPLLFVACNNDRVAVPAFGDASHAKYAKGPVTRKEIDGDHWGLISHATEVNEILVEWIREL
ncbi:alpha/beta-hydrolase [Mycena galopus ATCC 62051]|nr:alpha/beta-hydrolase [Mycena galopus ATCC 62051]